MKNKGGSNSKWKIKMKTDFFCDLLPGLSVFSKSRINIGSWFGVITFDADSTGIPELMCQFPLITALFAFLCLYTQVVFCRPLQISATASGSHTWVPEKAVVGGSHGSSAKVSKSDCRVLDALCFRHWTKTPERSLIKKLLSTDLQHSVHSWASQARNVCHQSPVKICLFPAHNNVTKDRC